MKLYELTGQLNEIRAMAEAGDIDEQTLIDTLAGVDVEYKQKVEACLHVRNEILADVAAIDCEIDRLQALKDKPAKDADKLLDYVKGSMLSTKQDKVCTGLYKLTLRKATKKLGAIDEAKVPAKYWNKVPATRKLDKKLLLSAVKTKPIDGVELIDGVRSLTIK